LRDTEWDEINHFTSKAISGVSLTDVQISAIQVFQVLPVNT